MSTSTASNLRDITSERLRGSLDRYNKDMRHFSDAQFAASPGGDARSPLAITAEVGLFNYACAKTIAGDDVPAMSEDSMNEMMNAIDTREKAIDALINGTEALANAIESVSEDGYQSKVMAPWGQPVTKQYLADTCCMHMDYHDGQLNIIQCMNGDTTVHWMEE